MSGRNNNNNNKRTNSLPSIDGRNSKKIKGGEVQNQAVANIILPELLNSNENRCQTPPNQRITPLTNPFVRRKGLVLNSVKYDDDSSGLEFP
jgi:hypothetical protein